MSRSSEEVLVIVTNVRHKKVEGSLYMMGERMAWMQDSKNSFGVSHMYADIKAQKISPESKEKVQLQVVMHDASANTFHFNNPMGRDAQKADREKVKEILQQLLPRFRRKINSELEEKNRMLQEDPELFQLYKDLVVSQVITAEEFWASRTKKQDSRSNHRQEVGVSAAFLADIKPQADGCNGLRYNLTADIIESIFRTYPAVKKKHAECVPDKISESEFWTRFFQSHYFHRDRINLNSKDLFSDCAKTDEDDIKQQINSNVSNPLMDLTGIKDSNLLEGYGNSRGEGSSSVSNPTNLSIIRRFNHHSTMVLKAFDNASADAQQNSESSNSAVTATIANGNTSNNNKSQTAEPPTKKARIREKLEYEDLAEQEKKEGSALNLTHMERYLHGPTPVTATQYTTSEDVRHASQALLQEMSLWKPILTQTIPSNTAVSILGELSPGGALMHGTSQQQLHRMISVELQQELKALYNALCELLRHFWSCFPASSKLLEEKLVRMKTNLEKYQVAKLQPFAEKLAQHHYTVNLTGHMQEMLETAFRKFTTWQNKRLSRGLRTS